LKIPASAKVWANKNIDHAKQHLRFLYPFTYSRTPTGDISVEESFNMSAEGEPASRVAIGIAFGNSYSSIAYTTPVGRNTFVVNNIERYLIKL
jgi:hypothetical protein